MRGTEAWERPSPCGYVRDDVAVGRSGVLWAGLHPKPFIFIFFNTMCSKVFISSHTSYHFALTLSKTKVEELLCTV